MAPNKRRSWLAEPVLEHSMRARTIKALGRESENRRSDRSPTARPGGFAQQACSVLFPSVLDLPDNFARRLEGEIEKTPAILEVERYEADAQKRDRNPVNKFVARD